MVHRYRYVYLCAAVLLSGVAGMAQAASDAQVSATVTVQNISVSVTDGSIAYGTLGVGTSKSTIAGQLGDTQTVENTGNVAENINISGQDSANWTLAGTPGANQYSHLFCKSGCSTPPTGFTALATTNTTLVDNLAVSGTQVFDLLLQTPTSTTFFTEQSVNVTVQAVAAS